MAKNDFNIKYTGDIKELKKFLSRRNFKNILNREVEKATIKNGLIMQAEIRKRIREKRYMANAKVTLMGKKSQTPLINTGLLHNSIRYELINSFKARVGIAPGPVAKIAKILHEGYTLRITDKTRAAIFGRIRSNNKSVNVLPSVKSKNVIRMKGRPFLESVYNDRSLIKELNKNWDMAVKKAIIISTKGRGPEK